jgi:hypothetical protein
MDGVYAACTGRYKHYVADFYTYALEWGVLGAQPPADNVLAALTDGADDDDGWQAQFQRLKQGARASCCTR